MTVGFLFGAVPGKDEVHTLSQGVPKALLLAIEVPICRFLIRTREVPLSGKDRAS